MNRPDCDLKAQYRMAISTATLRVSLFTDDSVPNNDDVPAYAGGNDSKSTTDDDGVHLGHDAHACEDAYYLD